MSGDVVMLGRGVVGDCGKCVRPLRFLNMVTGEVYYSQCYAADPEKCGPCSDLKRGDLKAVFRSGFTARPGDRHFFATLTAPGQSAIPWDRAACRERPAHVCSGDLGCVVDVNAAAAWHAGLRKRMSYFRQMMRRFIAAESGVLEDLIDVQVGGSWEMQKRGVLHRHAMFRVTGSHRVTEAHVRAAFERYRSEFGFGPRFDLVAIEQDAVPKVAGYLAKYCTKDVANLAAVPCGFDVAAGGRPGCTSLRRSERFRPWSTSRGYGDTLAVCRGRRVAWATLGGCTAKPGAALGAGGEAALDLNPRISTTRGVPSELPGVVECGAM